MLRTVDNLSLDITYGDSVAFVGESGCGMRLLDPTSGTVDFDGIDIGAIPAKDFVTSRYRPCCRWSFRTRPIP